MERTTKLAEKFRKEGEKTTAFLTLLPDDIWEEKLYTDGGQWSVKEVLAHIVESERAHLFLIKNILDGGSGVAKEFDIDEYNANSIDKYAQLNFNQLIEAFTKQRNETVDFVGGLSEDDLEMSGRNPFLGETNINEMLRLVYLHINLHIRDVRSLREVRQENHGE